MSVNDPVLLNEITIIKRNGKPSQTFNIQKIIDRITRLIKIKPVLNCNSAIIANSVKNRINTKQITTSDIDEMTAKQSYDYIDIHPDYGLLGARIKVANLHKITPDCFSTFINEATDNINYMLDGSPHNPLINSKLTRFVKNNKNRLNKLIDDERDFTFDWLGICTLIDKFLLKRSGDENDKKARPQDYVIERPQYMWMRIACSLSLSQKWIDDTDEKIIDRVESIYNYLSRGLISLATPTMKNAGTFNEQLLSCFLLRAEDSTDSIMKLACNIAQLSKGSGGLGWSKNFRPNGTEVKKTQGKSSGEGPFLKIYEKVLEAFDQGSGRPGSGADYKRIWEADFMTWIRYKRPHEPAEFSIRKLFYACWVDDYFMKCVENDWDWYFISQYEYPELIYSYGEQFEEKYKAIVKTMTDGKNKKYKAREVWNQIITTIIETGMPYISFADRVNELSNQKNIGLIHNSNLCNEIVEVCTENRIACCCLATLPVNRFLKLKPEYEDSTYKTNINKSYKRNKSEYLSTSSSDDQVLDDTEISLDDLLVNKYEMDWKLFQSAITETVWILNKVIDINHYPVEEAKLANMEQRPLGIGIQGMADALGMMNIVWGSPECNKYCSQIAEVLHYTSLRASSELAKQTKKFYPYFKPNNLFPNIEPSDLAKGIFHWEQWNTTSSGKYRNIKPVITDVELFDKGITDWETLRTHIKKYGITNSLLNAYPPTATSSNIRGNIESFEPFKKNIYLRKTNNGNFIIINKYLVNILLKLNLWNKKICKQIIEDNGSIQKINVIPDRVKQIFKTADEIGPKILADISALYAPFVDQTMSDNIFINDASDGKLITKILFHRWKLGLKTGMYYLKQSNNKGRRKFVNDSIKINKEDTGTSSKLIDNDTIEDPIKTNDYNYKDQAMFCTRDNPDCEACQS